MHHKNTSRFATCPACGHTQPQHPDGRFFAHSDPTGPRGARCLGRHAGRYESEEEFPDGTVEYVVDDRDPGAAFREDWIGDEAVAS
ncbi:hypothetical protein ACXYTP_23615 [Tsukamurella ocularis]